MAKVDQWVDFVWHEIEVVVGAVLVPARDGEPPFNAKQVRKGGSVGGKYKEMPWMHLKAREIYGI